MDCIKHQGGATSRGASTISLIVRRIVAPVALAAVCLPLGAWAQTGSTAATADQGQDSGELQEVIVTAERRSEDVQKTPINVTVMTGEELREQGYSQESEILKNVAGVLLQGGTDNTQVAIRGVSTQLPGGTGQSAVANVFDNLYSYLPGSTYLGYYDVGNVEVLRGPQTTLYGRNATGGVVSTHFQDPVLNQFTGYGQIQGGNYGLMHAEGALNLPVSSTFALRAAFSVMDRNGYISNGAGDDVAKGGRLKALWQPSDYFSMVLTGEYIRIGGQGVGAFVPGTEYNAGHYWTNDQGQSRNVDDETNYKTYATINVTIPNFATLTVEPGYIRDYNDNDTFAYADIPAGTTAGGYTLAANDNQEKSLEVRLSSAPTAPFVWNLGYYYYDLWQLQGDTQQGSCYNTASGQYLTAPMGYEYSNSGCGAAYLVALTQPEGQIFTGGTDAFFGQVTVPVTSQWRLLAGVRYNNDTAGEQQFASPTGGPPAGSRSARFTAFDWRVGSEYDITPQSMAYLTVATAHRDGGINPFGGEFAQEKLLSYELGAKNRFLNNKLQLNADVYYYDYSDWQYFTFVVAPTGSACLAQQPPGSTSCLIGSNAPHTTEYGLELDTQAYATDNDIFHLAGTLSHSAFGSGFTPPGTSVSLGGQQLPEAPNMTLIGGYQHIFKFSNGASVTPRLDVQYVSGEWLFTTYGTAAQTTSAVGANTHEGGHATEDFSLAYNEPNGKWVLNAYVHNLSNKAYRTGIQPGGAGGVPPASNVNFTVDNPRTFGVTLTAHF